MLPPRQHTRASLAQRSARPGKQIGSYGAARGAVCLVGSVCVVLEDAGTDDQSGGVIRVVL